ncbi:hypothetical protein BsWGS_06960 [Bradybaena similaris]
MSWTPYPLIWSSLLTAGVGTISLVSAPIFAPHPLIYSSSQIPGVGGIGQLQSVSIQLELFFWCSHVDDTNSVPHDELDCCLKFLFGFTQLGIQGHPSQSAYLPKLATLQSVLNCNLLPVSTQL